MTLLAPRLPVRLVGLVGLLGVVAADAGAAVIATRSAAGPNAAAIQAAVDAFRADLGVNNGLGPCAGSCVPGVGRREINWDAVPDSFSSGGANPFPGDFFGLASGNPAGRVRGITFNTTGAFEVSADADSDGDGNPGPVAPLFGNHLPANADDFAAFSPERIFGLVGTNQMDVRFHLPGNPGATAGVRGFGAVFTDVELAGSTVLDFFDASDALLLSAVVPNVDATGGDTNDTFSFLGVAFDAPSVYRVRITNGGYDLDLQQFGAADTVAMDDFLYGEPVPEPATGLLLAAGVAGLAAARRRHARQ